MATLMPALKRTPSGLWTARKVIPEDVRAAFGKREEKPTWPANLTATEAKRRFGEWVSDVEARIDRLRRQERGQVVDLSHRETVALAGRWYADVKRQYEDNPGDPEGWEAALEAMQPDLSPEETEALGGQPYLGPWLPQSHIVEGLEAVLEREGLAISATSRTALVAEAHDLYRALCRLMIRRAAGDYGADRHAATLPEWRGPQAPKDSAAAVALDDLFAAYIAEAKPAPATQKSWRTNLKHLKDHLGHDDATRVTPEDFVAWKERLLTEEIAPGRVRSNKTVNDKYLASVRTVFRWASDNKKVSANPTVGVRVRQRKRTKLRDRGLTDAEAQIILTATRVAAPNLSLEHQRARRWVPWLCAYSGARVNEITQLRKQDVFTEDGVSVMRITPEAGGVKTGEARVVPLHPHVLDQGFLEVVAALPAGPIFYNPARRRGGSEENPLSKKVGERLAAWVREVGVTDPGVAPNHGWRHRFMTVGRAAHIPLAALDAMEGHATKTDGDDYGKWTPKTLLDHLKRMPRYETSTSPINGELEQLQVA